MEMRQRLIDNKDGGTLDMKSEQRDRTTIQLKKMTSEKLQVIAEREGRTKQGQVNYWVENYYRENKLRYRASREVA